MKKAVVTGGAGFIGAHVVDALVAQGVDVHVIDNFSVPRREDRIHPSATYHAVDVRDYEAIAPIIAKTQWVFHLAALPRVQFSIDHPLESLTANVNGTATVLRAASQGTVEKVVCASSGAVYGDESRMPLREDMEPKPKSPYALHKWMLERLCALWSEVYETPTVSLRYFNVYGPRMDPEGAYALAVPKFIAQRAAGRPITVWGDGSHSRDYVHVSDVARANLMAAQSDKVGTGEVVNIGTGRATTILELVHLIGGPVVHEAERLEPQSALADIGKARTLLGWEPEVDLTDGIAELKKLANIPL